MSKMIFKSEDEWKEILDPERYRIMRMRKTEAPYSGEYLDTYDEGVYRCAACDNRLFGSRAKYDSKTGWPSFFQPLDPNRIDLGIFSIYGTEVMCARCGAHLGHVFEDGPEPTGKRYCINSVALKLDRSLKEYAHRVSEDKYYGTPE